MDPRQKVVAFAKDNSNIPVLQFIQDDPEGVNIKLITGHGVVNYVYRVTSADDEFSIILKYAEESLRCLPEEKLSLERQEVEFNCLKLMYSIQPGSVPKPYHIDKRYNILAMEDMRTWNLLGTELEKRRVDLTAAKYLGKLMGKVHLQTTRDNVSKEKWAELKEKFTQAESKEYIRLFTLDRQCDENDDICNPGAENLEVFHQYVKDLKNLGIPEKFNKLYGVDTCFIHGDCHYKSVFVKEGKAALFDFEMAFLGHPGFNVSLPVACYVMMCYFDNNHVTTEQEIAGPSKEQYKTDCLQAIRNILVGYLESETDISKTESKQRQFIEDLTLLTGVCIWMLGCFAQMDEICNGLNGKDRRQMMVAAFQVIKQHQKVHTPDEFMNILTQNI